MAQGKLKVKSKLPEKAKRKHNTKGSAVTKRANRPITPKKAKLQDAHKLKRMVTKTINKAVEDEMRAKALDSKKQKLSKAQEAVASHNTRQK